MTTRATGTPTAAAYRGEPAGAAPAAQVRPPVDPPPHSPKPKSRRPHADCTADTAGGITIDVRLSEGQAATSGMARAVEGGAALLLRRRGGGEGPDDTARLPLGPTGTEGVMRAVLPSIMTLPEGRWDAFLAVAEAEPQRLLSGLNDLRSLVDRVPRQGRTWLGVRIPYATKYGNLTVRSWLRWPHAEAGQLHVEDGRMRLRGVLFGAPLGGAARIEARPRDGGPAVCSPAAREVRAPGRSGGRAAWQAGAEPDAATGFTAELPFAALAPGHRVWDLWLRPEEGAEPVRIARILDDVHDKGQIFSYPPQRVTDAGGVRTVRPYYTLDNDLSLRVCLSDA
ncbi:hypothetical protein H181DRAFT_04965 [Streptomyces sp. WMMB 714]|jgi:hypothetical protein|uniref:hypothetical protein n=1 Tax=Streptomyces sp. WMMB 714 TaxID=1286822 RepID=UPI0006965CB7|nr:hypothetical protein [Streptomyces sp. WMMB 714]SCK54093.1 hypothetical protein H181DRAFT_04965 [Streptomyces sp. WMMB 714]